MKVALKVNEVDDRTLMIENDDAVLKQNVTQLHWFESKVSSTSSERLWSLAVFTLYGAQDRRKVNRIAGDSNAHRIKDILPDDIAVKCLPISGAKFSCDRFRHALLRDLRKMDVQQLYLHLGSNDILTNEAVFYRYIYN
ncbi:hypothetical protein DPMN_107016 [Dreissena polymorpha]|uniref:Uncharacterized protein n=1 Tax=Dreissena polymorpha TaxID=45954 RepID=A0A9D4K6B5_DREPO|nr:hypothetical protein DPMN_107016 [Dreissena polymorpha]